MAIASIGSTLGTNVQVSPEERQMNNERKRINGYIRAYQRSPGNWNPSMVASLERLTTQYGVPFQREVQEASVMENIGAGVVGAADALAMDFIPDDWYSSESTRTAKNIGKGVGTAGAILASGGAALAAKGALGAGRIAAAAGGLGKAAAFTPTGQLSKQAIGAGQRAYGSFKGLASTDDILRAVNKSPGEIASLVKGKNLNSKQVDNIVDAIQSKHGNGAYAAKLVKQVKTSGAKPTDLSSKQVRNLVDELGTEKNATKKLFTTKKVKTKGKKPTIDKDTGQATLFDETEDVITESKKIVDNLKPIAEKANLSAKQIKELAKKLKDNKIDTFDDAAEWLIKSQKAVESGGIGAINYMDAGIAAGAGVGALTPLAGLEPSRAQKEAADLDPYN